MILSYYIYNVLRIEISSVYLNFSLHIWLKHKLILHFSVDIFVEDTLWTGIPGNYTNPDAPKTLSEVRKLVDNGEYAEATEVAVKLSGDPSDVCYFNILSLLCIFSSTITGLKWDHKRESLSFVLFWSFFWSDLAISLIHQWLENLLSQYGFYVLFDHYVLRMHLH